MRLEFLVCLSVCFFLITLCLSSLRINLLLTFYYLFALLVFTVLLYVMMFLLSFINCVTMNKCFLLLLCSYCLDPLFIVCPFLFLSVPP